ncbi:MAG: hypothetical protein A2X05_16275 [Bacteroidetes bacterium GWE2_41_25]|nr:MAG: hypothetical protein A2X03_02970 [Bacteroidetes bacterium GWA2_40_15]OFX93949.1 MAG: hypothetical protein A2X05_16275 [Bacteroidetes bacterium GWE2_41_25]OFY00887.1 MAG: hypothetical protein A2X06_04895 [Bacteroidetes bacterium GWC2_40_22]OFY57091.1 MAG: hypothetical protein A2X04_05150 [Bacteroidetes bacterium GWF2_41_9]
MRGLLVIFFLGLITLLHAQPFIDLETGFVTTGYNDVRIPGDQGTLFSLSEDLEAASSFFIRIKAGYKIRERHNLSVLYAPLSVKSDGYLPYDVSFAGAVFPADSALDAMYKFNSYRLTYRYDIVLREKVEFGLGFTAKIRDAAITLKSPGYFAEKTNVGFVPVINFRLLLNMDERLSFLLEGDALAAPQGRAEDILFAAQYKLNDQASMRAGYRLLEGGADNDEVYNFSMFNYASLGFTYTFNK